MKISLAEQHVAGRPGAREGLGVEQQRAGRHLLHVEHRADLARHLGLDVVALVEHQRRRRRRAPKPPPRITSTMIRNSW